MHRTSLALLVATACARPPDAAPTPPPAVARPAPVVPSVAAAPDAAVTCPWTWGDDTALTAPRPPEGMPSGWDVACTADELVLATRTGTHLAVTRRALEASARWSEAVTVADDVLSLGRPGVVGSRVWLTWVSTRRGLRAAAVAEGVRPVEPAMPAAYGTFASPVVLGGEGETSLVLARYHRLGADRVVLMRLGFDRPAAGAVFGQGEVVSVRGGADPVAIVATREPAAQGGPGVMRAHRVDVRAALAMTGSPPPGHIGAMPEGSDRVGEPLAVGRGRFEVSPLAPGAEAVVMQTAIGAERGTVRVVWFPERGAPEVVVLPFAAQALGGAVAEEGRAVAVTWWDDDNVLQRARVTPEGIGEARATGAAEVSARAAQQVARDTRTVWCGGAPWVVQARAQGASVRWRARRVACGG